MVVKTNIQWHSKIFITLRIFQILLAIAVLVIVVPKSGSGSYFYRYGLHLNKRNPIPEPRRGGSSDSYSSSSSSSYGETYARYITPYMALSVAALTIKWCIIAFFKYFRHTLRPKVSMGWDIAFMIFWLGLIICNAIGMSEGGAWVHPLYWNPSQYTIFIISVITFFVFTWSYFNGRRAHKVLGPGKTVPADLESTQMRAFRPAVPAPEQAENIINLPQHNSPQYFNSMQPQQYNPPRFSVPRSYNEGEQLAPAPYPQGYSSHSPQSVPRYAGSHYVPPTPASQYGAPLQQQYYPPR